MISCVK